MISFPLRLLANTVYTGFVQNPSVPANLPFADVRNRVANGVYVIENCEVVSINTKMYDTNVNHTLRMFVLLHVNLYGEAELYVCDADADAHLYLEAYGSLDVHILYLGEDNEDTISTSTSTNQGSLVTPSGGLFEWDIDRFADFSINHWTDPDGVC